MKKLAFLFCLVLTACQNGAPKSGPELLEKSIAFHDPDKQWDTLKTHLFLSSTDTAGVESFFELKIDNTEDYFAHISHPDGKNIEKGVSKGKEFFKINGDTVTSGADREKYDLNSKSVKFLHSFYMYLYGLPMKLQDEGAIIDRNVRSEVFKGKTYQTLGVTYKPEMGEEVWTFFMDPETSAMQAYRFMFSPGSAEGEYVLLDEIVEVDGMKIPKVRKWFLVKGDQYLGTDKLLKAEEL